MDLGSQVLFLLSAFGGLNALILSVYFGIIAHKKKFSNWFLSLLLLVISVRILKSAFYYIIPNLADSIIQIGLTACSLIGPFLYLYIRSQIKNNISTYIWILNILPYLAVLLIVGWEYPYWSYKELWSKTLVPLIYLQWIIYIVLAVYLLKDVFRRLYSRKDSLNDREKWFLNIVAGIFIIWFAYVLGSYVSYIVGALSFSFVFYLLILLWVFKNKHNSLFFENKSSYEDKAIDEEQLEQITKKLKVVEEKKLYQNSDLKLADLAQEINISTHILSQYLNDNLGKSFSLYINEFRIEEAKRLLHSKHNYTIEAIGYESGFNTKSTFFSAFKKITGLTPSGYKNKV
ncbi:AraC family transcriptional regulator [Gramella sp. KN1008]|uniref:helix-turn-helix domain-containing protein n=1 Tax=Gramella sp. KN1008 TaxID=2529298 RepID=UPI00103A6839|nr:helix-turn-helix domain-containing protein [Gramella sp. KN1008]TBW26561.1 AraC family transcriptional regulator [Gramella sp. KN1008]